MFDKKYADKFTFSATYCETFNKKNMQETENRNNSDADPFYPLKQFVHSGSQLDRRN